VITRPPDESVRAAAWGAGTTALLAVLIVAADAHRLYVNWVDDDSDLWVMDVVANGAR
jgi:hypothetical protein